jgi:hypothetical protein
MSDLSQLIESLKAAAGADERLALLRAYAAANDGRGRTGTYDFEREATDLAVEVPGLIGLAEKVLRNDDGEPALRFLCVAIAFNGRRRERHPDAARGVLDHAAAEFGGVPLFGHFQAMALEDGPVADLRRGLELAWAAHAQLPDNAGIDHTCAVFIADLASNDDFPDPGPELRHGLELVNEAIERYHDKGRFYHTRARLKRLLHDYDGARVDIARAIDLERQGDDAPERRVVYLIERSMIDADRHIAHLASVAEESNARLTADTDKLKATLEASQIQAIEVIGFVTAILGLVMATLGEIRGQSPQDALIVLAGVAVLLFGAVFFGSWMLRRRMSK